MLCRRKLAGTCNWNYELDINPCIFNYHYFTECQTIFYEYRYISSIYFGYLTKNLTDVFSFYYELLESINIQMMSKGIFFRYYSIHLNFGYLTKIKLYIFHR